MLKHSVWLFLILLLISSCTEDQNPLQQPNAGNSSQQNSLTGKNTDNGWLIPFNQIVDGGPGRDGIAAINEPRFLPVDQVDFLEEDALVVGIKIGEELRAYPHAILDRHEIVNDFIGTTPVGVSFCYLTGSAIGWDRNFAATESLLGVSGLLFNSNLIVFDRVTDSHWAQMKLQCVEGERICEEIKQISLVEMSWASWKALFPESEILSTETGFDRDYTEPPLSAYVNESSQPIFPVYPLDDRLPFHRRMHGIIELGRVRVYDLSLFEGENRLLEEAFVFGFEPVVILGDAAHGYIVSYYSLDEKGTKLDFTLVDDNGKLLMRDQDGSLWNIWGEAVSGLRKGQQLRSTKSFMAYWFAWGAFYPGAEIYVDGERVLGG